MLFTIFFCRFEFCGKQTHVEIGIINVSATHITTPPYMEFFDASGVGAAGAMPIFL
jgi:hypothetical protein